MKKQSNKLVRKTTKVHLDIIGENDRLMLRYVTLTQAIRAFLLHELKQGAPVSTT